MTSSMFYSLKIVKLIVLTKTNNFQIVSITVNPSGSFKVYGYPDLVAAVLSSNTYDRIDWTGDGNGVFPPKV